MTKATLFKRAIPLAILAVGMAAAVTLAVTRPQPTETPQESRGRLVRTFRASPTSHRVAVHAYGTSRAGDEWAAIAEVSGRINMLEEAFEQGEIIPAGTLLATIDKLDYELAVKSAATKVASQKQQQVELVQTKANLEGMTTLRQQQLKFAKSELDRIQGLLERGAGTQADYERAFTAYVDRQASLRDLENQLALIPIQEQSLSLATDAATLQLQQAERDLDRCELRLPFTGLCIARDVELHQQTTRGEHLGQFLALEHAEVIAMVEPRRALALLPSVGKRVAPIDLASQTTSLFGELRRRFDALQMPVDVTWRAGEGQAQWRGRLVRPAATFDETTRSIPLIIEVADAFSEVQIGIKPPLVPGMFVDVVIYGQELEEVFVVPRDVVRDDSVHVIRDGRLVVAPVDVAALEEDIAIIESGLVDGDHVVLADLFPAANGMQLRAKEVANPVQPREDLPPISSQKPAMP